MRIRMVQLVLVCLAGQMLAVSGCYNCVTCLVKSSAKYKASTSLTSDFRGSTGEDKGKVSLQTSFGSVKLR